MQLYPDTSPFSPQAVFLHFHSDFLFSCSLVEILLPMAKIGPNVLMDLYVHYLDFCEQKDSFYVNLKIYRQFSHPVLAKFPHKCGIIRCNALSKSVGIDV